MLRLALWAQRRAHRVPAPVRRLAGRALARLGGRGGPPAGPSEDWTVPLVPGRGGGDLEQLKPSVAPPAPEPARTVPRPVDVRCVVAADVLDVGGMDEFVGFLGRGLPELGVATTVVYTSGRQPGTTGEGGRVVRALAGAGVPTVQLSQVDGPAWLEANRPDVISAHGAPDWLLAAAARLGVPWVETLHGMHAFLHRDAWAAEQVRSRQISAQIAVSELVRRQYLARVPGFAAERLVTIPNGTDERRSAPVDRSLARAALGLRDEFLFVSLARFGLQKNTFGLVTAFAEVAERYPDSHLLVAGRADDALYFEHVRRHAGTLAGADRIHLRGHCANAAALLSASDAFVLDSFFEGWPLATMEALAVGVPVVSSDVGGAREQIGDAGRRGHVVDNPAGDPELLDWQVISDLRFRPQGNRAQLVDAMSAVVEGRDRWAAGRGALRDEARAAFPAGTCLRRHASVLRAVASGQPLPLAVPAAP